MRAQIILKAADGVANHRIAGDLNVSRPTVLLWRRRFLERGTVGLTEIAEGRGRKSSISAAKEKQIVEATLHTKPKAATHWSCRTMAKAQGVSAATVHRIWDANGLKPHRVKTFKLSTDKQFTQKLTDV